MERAELSGHCRGVTTLRFMQRAMREACDIYQIPVPSVMCGTRALGGLYCPVTHRIFLHPECGHNLLTLAHELAHHVVVLSFPRSTDHGPVWVRTYAELLDLLRLVPIAGMRAICRRHGVKMAPRGKL